MIINLVRLLEGNYLFYFWKMCFYFLILPLCERIYDFTSVPENIPVIRSKSATSAASAADVASGGLGPGPYMY